MNTYYLLPHGKGWKLTTEGGKRIFSGNESKEHAIRRAELILSQSSGMLKIFNENGTLEEDRIYQVRAVPIQRPLWSWVRDVTPRP